MDKVFLILGGSSDIGTKLIETLNGRESDSVIIVHYYQNKEKISDIECLNNNKIVLWQADFMDSRQVLDLIDFVKEEYGCPTAIVHLPADKYEFVRFTKITEDSLERALRIQVFSIIKILQAFLPQMVKGKNNAKVLVMLSENTILKPARFTASYTMIKYMLLGLVKTLAVEYEGKRININAISPTTVDTKFLNNIDERFLEVNGVTEKMLCVEEVIPSICFLLSEAADHINGANIHISV